MIHTKDLEFYYDKSQRFLFPDIQVAEGAQTLIIGESGCGKTTLLHLLSGLLTPTKGIVNIYGQDLGSLSQRERDAFRGKHIGLVFQKSYFVGSLNTRDNISISPYAKKAGSSGVSRVEEIAERLGIRDLLDKRTSELSVGEQQRAGIARALMNSPKLILADEPTSALDNKNCAAVISLLREQAQLSGAALLVVTHDDRLKSEIEDHVELADIKAMAS